MAQTERLRGVDLVRCLAAYGVVVIHTLGDVPHSYMAERLVAWSLGFVVPYFLAVSLFLTVGRLLEKGTSGFLRGRVARLIVPYVFWSLVFVAVRCILYAASGRYEDLRRMFTSPLPIIFLGTASADLYFIPLLLVGEVLAVLLVGRFGVRLRQPSTAALLGVLGVVALAFGPLRDASILKDPQMFSALRVVLTLAAYAIWNVPYLCAAVVFHVPCVRRRIAALPFAVACGLAALGFASDFTRASNLCASIVPHTAWEPLTAFALLAFAIAISPKIPALRWLSSLSACTFGIYLMHPLMIEVSERLIRRLGIWRGPYVDAPTLAAVAGLTFGLSWGFVALTMRVPICARMMYGERRRPPLTSPARGQGGSC